MYFYVDVSSHHALFVSGAMGEEEDGESFHKKDFTTAATDEAIFEACEGRRLGHRGGYKQLGKEERLRLQEEEMRGKLTPGEEKEETEEEEDKERRKRKRSESEEETEQGRSRKDKKDKEKPKKEKKEGKTRKEEKAQGEDKKKDKKKKKGKVETEN